ncbi:hypothetical protein SFRURICE_019455 [Spodoptera frugiperda]|nr:hypothetical protein SFRURICE_019455 [Spodoptera frugiperda]
MTEVTYKLSTSKSTDDVIVLSCIAHTKFTCELRRIENYNEQQLGRKPARLITSPAYFVLELFVEAAVVLWLPGYLITKIVTD